MYFGGYTGVGHEWTEQDAKGEGPDPSRVRASTDVAAYWHDYGYQLIQEEGINPYYTWNSADRQMERKINRLLRHRGIKNTPLGYAQLKIAQAFLSVKKRLFRHSGNRKLTTGEIAQLEHAMNKLISNNGVNIKMPVYDDTLSGVRTMQHRKRHRTPKKPALTKRQRKAVKRAANAPEYTLIYELQTAAADQSYTPYNRVTWTTLSRYSAQTIGDLDYKTRDRTATGEPVPMQVLPATGNYVGIKAKRDWFAKYKFFNNTNTQGEITLYRLRSKVYHGVAPVNDLESRRDMAYNSQIFSSTTLPLVQDHFQYWSTPGVKSEYWEMNKKIMINLKGGETAEVDLPVSKITIDFNEWLENESSTYVPGDELWLMRVEGRLTHTNTESVPAVAGEHPGLYNEQTTQFFAFDYQRQLHLKVWLLDAPEPVDIKHRTQGGYTDVAAGKYAVCCDPELPGVASPDQT